MEVFIAIEESVNSECCGLLAINMTLLAWHVSTCIRVIGIYRTIKS